MRFERFPTLTLLLVSTAILVMGLSLLPAHAQSVVNGDISGTVTDAAGAVVQDATVSLTDIAEGKNQNTPTNATGLYRFSFLKPGEYKVTIGAKGFKSTSQVVNVAVGQVTTINAKLEIGAASEVVEGTGAAPLIQTENGEPS